MTRSSSLRQSSPQLPSLQEIKAELARREAARERGELKVGSDTIRARCQTLAGFVREAWHILEPSTAYIHNWHIDAICEHLEAVTSGRINRLLINVPPGSMKALDSDTPVLTLDGWKRHGDLRPGDFVYGPDGVPKRVLACTQEVLEASYRVRFDNGDEIIAGAGHEWAVEREEVSAATKWRRCRKPMIVETPALQSAVSTKGKYARPDRIRTAAPVWAPQRHYLIDPYLLGAWLGDGSSTSGIIYAADEDAAHFAQLGTVSHINPPAGSRRQAFHHILVDCLQSRLRVLGLLGNKHVPEDYLLGNYEQRLALLQGLMDTDGHSAGPCIFTNKNKNLIDAVAYLVASIGAKPYISSRFTALNGRKYGPHSVSFTPPPGVHVFRLARKQARVTQSGNPRTFARYVESVDPVGERVVKCIQVEGGIYLAGKWLVPTHNSLLVSVFWQAWEWGPKGLTSMRYLSTAFNDGPVIRDASKFLNLITSEWYQALWPEVRLTRTALTKMENSATGDRRAVAFGSLTSQRGDRLVIDDPHSTTTAESDVERNRTTRQFREGALNRLNDHDRSAIVIIMQRLHEDDMAGVILKLKMPFVHLMLPQEFEPERRCSTVIGFADPRTRSGELLDPVRWPQLAWDAFKRQTTAYAVAGQYQQRPAPREGGIFKRHWFSIVDAVPAGASHVRGWDLAASLAETAAFTAGVRLAFKDGIYYVVDVARERGGPADIERLIFNTAVRDTAEVRISIPQDPGQAAKTQVAAYAKLLAGFDVRFSTESKIGGAKEQRAMPVSAQAEVGNVKIIRADWNDDFLDEICSFPNGSFKDQTDALSRAFAMLLADQQSSGANWVEYYRRLSEEANGATVKPEFGYEIAAESDKKYRVRVPDGVTHVYLMDGQPIQVPADHIISVSADDAAALGRRGWERLDI